MKNLAISLSLSSAAILSSNPLDGLLAKLWFEEMKEKSPEGFNGDFHQRLPFLEYDEEGFYHISMPQYEIKGIENREFFKSFDLKMYRDIFPDKTLSKSVLNTGGGRYKSHIHGYELQFIEKVVFFLRGDKEKVDSLLKNLHFIGKKSSLGMGKIKKITIQETESDCSVIKDGFLMRNIPERSRYLPEIREDVGVCSMRLEHAYWEKEDRVRCIVPIVANKGGMDV